MRHSQTVCGAALQDCWELLRSCRSTAPHRVLHAKLGKGADGDGHHAKLKASLWLPKTPPTYPTLYFTVAQQRLLSLTLRSPQLTCPTYMSKLYTKSDLTNPMFGPVFNIRICHIKLQTYGSSRKIWKRATGYHSPQGYHEATSDWRAGATVLSDGACWPNALHTRSTLPIHVASLSCLVILDSEHMR